MTRKRTIPAVGAVITALAILTAGCSSGADHKASDHTSAAHSDTDAATTGDGDAPGIEAPGGHADAESAPIAPGYEHGTKVTALQIKGYRARIDVLGLPSTGPAKRPWAELGSPHPVKGGEEATTVGAQTTVAVGAPPALKVNVAGLNYAQYGAGHPPDTSGAVGPNNFIQTVNTSIGIYSKTGTRQNAFSFNTFFSQFNTGTPCDNQNGGDPQVIFDQPSHRWIVADLSYPSGGPYYLCMAVSDGPNITSSPADWTLYPYVASPDSLNDYPKIASGPSGLYVTSNMFYHFQSFTGAQVTAFKRSSLGTASLKAQTVKTSSAYGSLLAANSYAATATKGVEYLTSLESSTKIGLWQYKVNWKRPGRSTFTQTPQLITVNSYQPAGSVAEQGGSALDTLSDRPMYALQKATDGTLWFNHSVQVGSQAGVRWYQINPATGAVIQQSTFAPADGLSRWMGSVAVDKNGNMAVGFNTSSSSTHPSINYATRLAGDQANRLTGEGRVVKGTGSQTGISRWGDYSQMSIDPNNGCTFWYTGEYYLTTGGDWQTRIASFKFPGCS